MRRHTRSLVVAALIGTAAATAWAHEKGILKPATRTLTAGDTLAVAGEKFSRNARIALALVGIDGRVALGTVQADSGGAFASRLLVPDSVSPGANRLIAVADDGDEVAGLDVTVVVAVAGHAAHQPEATPEPSAERLTLERARHPAVTWGAIGLAVLALAAGGLLLRPHADDR